MKNNIAAIILAAGRGKRMKSKKVNKVALHLGDKPMILSEVEFLKDLSVSPVTVVVGFAKESVEKALEKEKVKYVFQKKRLGTAHAVSVALCEVPEDIKDVFVIQGDDSFFYRKENEPFIRSLMEKHFSSKSAITFLTLLLDQPYGVGRVVRSPKGDVLEVVEEKDATEEQRKIKEVNVACYIFDVEFLRKNIDKVKKSTVTGEYYLVSLIGMAVEKGEKVEAFHIGKVSWRGINTPEEFELAKGMFSQGL
jgi:bifunctional UDP-N-acetylglucosamine pyrophosphorylase / glucosamine-1-phosphate N-acetyltransferase